MGGFARYPWPQYLTNPPFYYNKNYKRAMAIGAFAIFVNSLWVVRYANYHQMVSPGFGSFIDPEHPQAPEQIRMI